MVYTLSDGDCRPTATELIKHPFFKKAKDRKYLQQTLVAIGPSLETRVQKVSFQFTFEYYFLLGKTKVQYMTYNVRV